MKKIVFTFLILNSLFLKSYSQELSNTLINDNLDELFINKNNPYGSIPVETIEKHLSESSKLYYFEIVYNGKTIYREGIKKTIPQSNDTEIFTSKFRFKYDNILLDASLINDSDKLILLESYKNKITEISGRKLLRLSDLEIIKKDYDKNKFIIQNPLENMIINIYKIEFK